MRCELGDLSRNFGASRLTRKVLEVPGLGREGPCGVGGYYNSFQVLMYIGELTACQTGILASGDRFQMVHQLHRG